MKSPHTPRVFITYSHDNLDHKNAVLELADRLRKEGVDANLDQYEPTPIEGWPRWTEEQIGDADFVLVICTEPYYRKVANEVPQGAGLGVVWEATQFEEHLLICTTCMAAVESADISRGRRTAFHIRASQSELQNAREPLARG